MKTAISVPDDTFRRVEQRAAELGMNRSEFYATAAERYLDQLDSGNLTQQIDEAVARGGDHRQDAIAAAGIRRLEELTVDDEW